MWRFRVRPRDLVSLLLLVSPLMAAVQTQLLHSHYYYYENQSGWDGVTYKATVARNFTGRYYEFPIETNGQPDIVFTLIVKSYPDPSVDMSVRLILYCRNGILSWSSPSDPPTHINRTLDGVPARMVVDGGYQFCNNSAEVPIPNGAEINVIGTEIFPSQWQPYISSPDFDFAADLYVMKLTVLTP